jgi:uncharacterized protein (DUF1800 family)
MIDASPEALVAHVLRRATIAPEPALVTRFVQAGKGNAQSAATAAIDWTLSAPPLAILPAQQKRDGWDDALYGWTTNLRSPAAGLHERMTWFWHGHFATSSEKVGNLAMLHAQQQLFRTHALGNFATLLHQIAVDPAMLLYLDLSGSTVEAPNENFAREFLELFTLGTGAYTEDDVKSASLAMAGYAVDYETAKITKDPKRSLGGEVVFLGRRGRLSLDDVIDVVLAQEQCAVYIAAKLFVHLVGVLPSNEQLGQLAKTFRASGYEIRPLVEAIVRSESFLTSRLNRPKFPIEWWVGAVKATGPFRADQDQNPGPWVLGQLNQLPHRPPNVAGWQITNKWLSSDQQLARASYTRSLSWRMTPLQIGPGTDLVAATLARASLYEVSDRTLQVLRDAAIATAGNADELTISRRLLTAAVCSPEFALA